MGGWSHGGHLTGKIIETGSGVLTLGIAVVPVTGDHAIGSVGLLPRC